MSSVVDTQFFCVVVVTKVEDSYLMNKTTVLAPADGWPGLSRAQGLRLANLTIGAAYCTI